MAFGGGILLGFVGGRLYGAAIPLLGGSKPAEATLSLALPYVMYLAGEDVFDVSGVVAVVGAGLTAGAVARARLDPDNWRYLERLWEQMGFWAGIADFRHRLAAGAEAVGGPIWPICGSSDWSSLRRWSRGRWSCSRSCRS